MTDKDEGSPPSTPWHWHGYAWNGPLSRPGSDPKPRAVLADAQPLSIDEQLKRSKETETVLTTHHTAASAYSWFEVTLRDFPRAAREPVPRHELTDVRAQLDRGEEPEWFYYSIDGRYIMRTLRICPSLSPSPTSRFAHGQDNPALLWLGSCPGRSTPN